MTEMWEFANVAGDLPEEFLRTAEAQACLVALRNMRDVLIDPSKHLGDTPQGLGVELLEELRHQLAAWVDVFDVRATEALGRVSPKNVANLALLESAAYRLRGRPELSEVPMRRWVWVTATGGGGNRPLAGLRDFVQAAQDWRNLSTLHSLLAPVSSLKPAGLTAMDHDFLVGSKIRLAWGAAEVAREIAKLCSSVIDPVSLESLLAYLERIGESPAWMSGMPESIPNKARPLAERMSMQAGELAGQRFSDLNSAREATLRPFVNVEGELLPVNLDASLRIHLPVLELARKEMRHHESSKLMEQVCANLLGRSIGMRVQAGPTAIHVSKDNVGELDIVATNHDSTRILNVEVKAQYEGDGIPTTQKLHSQGIKNVIKQLMLRKQAFEAGTPIYVGEQLLAQDSSAKFMSLAVTLHDYSGLVWRPEEPGRTIGANILTVADFAVITTILDSDRELIDYLEIREEFVASGRSILSDEIDFLAYFLKNGANFLRAQIARLPSKAAYVVPPRDIHPSLASAMQAPSPAVGRAVIAKLPLVTGI